MAQYPISIFNKGFRLFFIYVIPIGFVNYYPLMYILDKFDNRWIVISPLVTLIYIIPCIMIFYRGVKKYASTGS